jgi:hypothetical protein
MRTSPTWFGGRQRAAQGLPPLGPAANPNRRFYVLDRDRQEPHLEKHAALVTAALQKAGLPEAVTASILYCISNGDLDGARKLVDRELRSARALLEDVTEFEQMCEDD